MDNAPLINGLCAKLDLTYDELDDFFAPRGQQRPGLATELKLINRFRIPPGTGPWGAWLASRGVLNADEGAFFDRMSR